MQSHEEFMRLALAEAQKALAAGEFPVGCVFVYRGEVVARGHRLNSTAAAVNEIDHAEISALRELIANRPALRRDEIIVYSTMEPCLMCYATLLLNGIRTIVFGYEDVMGGGTDLPLAQLRPLYREMRVTVVPHILRADCWRLHKKFFENPENSYWRDSSLAKFTLGVGRT